MKTSAQLGLRWILPSIGLILVLGFSGCAGPEVQRLPPVSQTPTDRHNIGKFVWHDLMAYDIGAAKRFYGSLFNWNFEASEDPDYIVILNHSKPIGGIISLKSPESKKKRNRWLPSLSVKDVDQAAEFARTSGGLIYERPQTIPDRGRLAIVSDPQDALLVLLHSQSGDPPDRPLAMNEWMWDELWTREKDQAIEFYSLLAGYTHEVVLEDSENNYDVLKSGIDPRAGVATITRNSVHPMWVPYIRVQDPALMVEKVTQLGGQVILNPSSDFENGSIAIAVDPDGGVFAMQKWAGKPGEN
ncbi:MAG: VOC family protein [Methylococcales bacterium]